MMRYKKIVIGLDLTEMDRAVIKYASLASQIFEAEKIYFVYVRKPFLLSLVYEPDFPKNVERLEKTDLARIKKTVKSLFKNNKIKAESFVLEGNPMTELLQFTHQKKADLIIMGHKDKLTGSGIVPQKICRKANCSVLLVPEKSGSQIKKILVPVDFSPYSALALRAASTIAGKSGSRIIAQNIFYTPVYPEMIGYNHRLFREKIEEDAKDKLNRLVDKYCKTGFPVEKLTSSDTMANLGEQIKRIALAKKANMIVMGSKGKTNAAAVLLGSAAENVIKKLKNIPILIVKKKNETLGILKIWFK